jgi:acyl carrier protein
MKRFIADQIRAIAFRSVSDDEPLISANVIDSIGIVDLAVALESEFGVTIPFTEIQPTNFDSVDRIAAYLASKGVTSDG